MSSIFEEVKQLKIRQVVEFYGARVNRAGKFICPFHNDSHPSANIKDNYFNCFVCGAGGDSVSYVAKLFGLSNIDAARKLAADFGIQVEENKGSKLRAYSATKKIAAERKKKEDAERLISHTGSVLYDYHRYLWQGVNMCEWDTDQNTRGCQYLTQAAYYVECYNESPEEFSKQMKETVGTIERRLFEWNNAGQPI